MNDFHYSIIQYNYRKLGANPPSPIEIDVSQAENNGSVVERELNEDVRFPIVVTVLDAVTFIPIIGKEADMISNVPFKVSNILTLIKFDICTFPTVTAELVVEIKYEAIEDVQEEKLPLQIFKTLSLIPIALEQLKVGAVASIPTFIGNVYDENKILGLAIERQGPSMIAACSDIESQYLGWKIEKDEVSGNYVAKNKPRIHWSQLSAEQIETFLNEAISNKDLELVNHWRYILYLKMLNNPYKYNLQQVQVKRGDELQAKSSTTKQFAQSHGGIDPIINGWALQNTLVQLLQNLPSVPTLFTPHMIELPAEQLTDPLAAPLAGPVLTITDPFKVNVQQSANIIIPLLD
ncbi:MAG: hypothetical protein EZS28_022353 [Streblomastix strix]|uniref:Uncharacterized protein n=1 Tax=Streblomastix strix TaxID=222440 RepID=A0A5J4VHQ7_9EUKA|nr:MAG: hypothetical protein EZS28_022353 [Streblomastix strix]